LTEFVPFSSYVADPKLTLLELQQFSKTWHKIGTPTIISAKFLEHLQLQFPNSQFATSLPTFTLDDHDLLIKAVEFQLLLCAQRNFLLFSSAFRWLFLLLCMPFCAFPGENLFMPIIHIDTDNSAYHMMLVHVAFSAKTVRLYDPQNRNSLFEDLANALHALLFGKFPGKWNLVNTKGPSQKFSSDCAVVSLYIAQKLAAYGQVSLVLPKEVIKSFKSHIVATLSNML
jgi:hypothetical protein